MLDMIREVADLELRKNRITVKLMVFRLKQLSFFLIFLNFLNKFSLILSFCSRTFATPLRILF